jgi:hypothetical protein
MDDMDLPEGKTCGDCAHWKRCSNLIDDLTGEETTCDFAPSRFKAKVKCYMCGERDAVESFLGQGFCRECGSGIKIS